MTLSGAPAVYRRLLCVLPEPFRSRFGDAMAADFADFYRAQALARPLRGIVFAWAVALTDLIATVAREHRAQLRARRVAAFTAPHSRASRLDMLIQDIRYGIRSLRKDRSFTLITTLTLALGIGATTAIFSVLNTVVLNPLPFPDPDRLVRVWELNPNGDQFSTSEPNFLDFRSGNRTLSQLEVYTFGSLVFRGEVEPMQIRAGRVSPGMFGVVGAETALGRGFHPDEGGPASARVVVLSHQFWTQNFNQDPAVIGRTIPLDGDAYEVIGVMETDATFPGQPAVWLPFAANPTGSRGDHRISAIGRLKDGVTIDEARDDFARIAQSLGETYPASNKGWGTEMSTFPDWIVGPQLRRTIGVLLGAVVLLLLMACVNVSNLLLARATARRRDIGIRAALGAGPGRIARQLMIESWALALFGGTVGVALAYGAVPLIKRLAPAGLPRIDGVAVNGSVLLFTLLVTAGTGLVFGLVPAIQVMRASLREALSEGGRTLGGAGRHVRDGLVAVQMALAVMLLIGAGLLVGSFRRLQQVDLGFEPGRVLTVQLGMTGAAYTDPAARMRFLEDALARVEALPGVVAAGATNVTPLSGGGTGQEVRVEGFQGANGSDVQFADWRAVTSGYFAAMALPLLRGRLFTPAEIRDGASVLVVTETLARRFWPDQDAIDKRIAFGTTSTNWNTVIGVVHDQRDLQLQLDPRPVAFVPYGAVGWPSMAALIRTASDPSQLAAAVRAEFRAADPALPVPNVQLLADNVDQAIAGPRFNLLLMSLFAAVALVLGAVGIYGVTGQAVDRRTREIGLRLALGDTPSGVISLMVRQGFGLVAIGALAGIGGAIGLTRFMDTLLYETAPRDPLAFGAAVAVLAGVALIATFIPAHRAGRVDPKTALDAA